MTPEMMAAVTGLLCLGAMILAGESRGARRWERLSDLVRVTPARSGTPRLPLPPSVRRGGWVALRAAGGVAGAVICHQIMGPLGAVVGAAGVPIVPTVARRRKTAQRGEILENQLAEVVVTTGSAVRSGLSIKQSLDLAAEEIDRPMKDLLSRMRAQQELGASFEVALADFQRSVGNEDVRLFGLVLGIHAKSGGNLGSVLDEVEQTIRHRLALRRELRALSAQGRISGAILGALPIAFFLILGVTSHRELAPIYRSRAGMAMIGTGLALQASAYLWIKRLLRVRV